MAIQIKGLVAYLKKNPALVGAAFAFVVLSGVAYLRYNKLSEHNAIFVENQKKLDRLVKNIANAAQLTSHLAELRDINSEIAKRALRPSELARNLQVFYKLESETGVKFTSDVQQMGAVSAPPSSTYTRLSFRVNITADYSVVLAFLRQMEVELVASKVTSVSFSPTSAGASSRSAAIVVEVLAHKS